MPLRPGQRTPTEIRAGWAPDAPRPWEEKKRKIKKPRGFALTKGERHPSARLSEEQVRAIRKMRGSHRKIGLQFGVSAAAVGKIKRRESWRSVK